MEAESFLCTDVKPSAPRTHHTSRSLILPPCSGTLHKAQHNRIFATQISNYQLRPLSQPGSFVPSVRNLTPNRLDSSGGMRARGRQNREREEQTRLEAASIPHETSLSAWRGREG